MKHFFDAIGALLFDWMCRRGFILLCSDAPDMSGINAAAQANAEIAKDALAFYKQQYADTAGDRRRAVDQAIEVSDAQLGIMKANQAISQDYNDYQKGTFRPLEKGIVDAASNYDTTARRESEADAAAVDVSKQMALQQASMQRQQASMGVNPNSGRAQAMARQSAIAQAAASAGAMNGARNKVELQGYARKMDAANLGRNLASNQATSAGVALNAGNSSVGNMNSSAQTAASGAALMGQGFNAAIQGNNSAGQLYGQAAQIQQRADSSGMEALGQLAGIGARLYMSSDKNVKSGIKPVSDEDALAAVNATPIKQWAYDPAKGGPDDGGQQHVGPMAQDVQRTMGDQVAPGGKQIDVVSMNGIAMKGIQALTKKVDRLAAQISAQGIKGARA